MRSTRSSCGILMKVTFSLHILAKYLNIKFHENTSSGSRVVPCRWTDRQTDMKLIVEFRNFANAPKNSMVKSKAYFFPPGAEKLAYSCSL